VDELLQHLVNALILGSTYALLGIGLTLIFGIMRVVNFTHGELYALGAYAVFFLEVSLGVNFFLALVLAVIIGCAVGAAIELVLLRPLLDADIDTTMLVMIGAWIVMQNTELFYWGGVSKAIMTPFPDEPLQVGPIFVSWLRLFVLVMALILIAATYVLINRTKLGKAMRATFQDRDTAALMGGNIKGIYTATFAIGSGLAAAAGALLGPVSGDAPRWAISPAEGVPLPSSSWAPSATSPARRWGFILASPEEISAVSSAAGYHDAMGF
jgi:branched-chain amino acid transport system permease protein